MTLVAVTTDTKRAQIMTDTWGYTFSLAMSTCAKQHVFANLNMVVAAQGSTTFQAQWLAAAHMLASRCTTFDAFCEAAPDELRDTWGVLGSDVERENAWTGARGEVAKSTIFHIGYSDTAGRFVAYVYSSEQDFEPIDITDTPYVMPTPYDAAPGPIEGPRLAAHFAANQFPSEDLVVLHSRPALTAPRNKGEWIELAKRVRRDRSECDLWSGFKTYVGGQVQLTTLERTSSRTETIHTYPDDNETLARVFAGSLHPLSQLAPCAACDSGHPYVECCLGNNLNSKPCPCGSPDTFEDCCSAARKDVLVA